MTLLELLRQELPKRGGWPEGYNYMTQDSRGSASAGKIYAYVNKPRQDVYYWINEDDKSGYGNFVMKSEIIAEDSITAIVTREQYEVASWVNGLPLVGANVEFTIGTYDIETDFDGILPAEGEIVEVIAHKTTSDGNDVAVVYWDDKGVGRSACFAPGRLRPLRTEAERAIDEMVQLSGVSTGAAKILYDAGYRKA
ncbi:hypothetical protein kpv79_05 [Klebsiella phage vB_KpnM_KpV79]|uniref:Uncharacterized protein n=1 Tax=Klebsiella phage vB_KpnM_KpV79 TaxID=2041212 RepID=A0A291LCF6_9CAUD|nr:hypothetical protein FDI70_gp05 [Klebsiella phage vB_KpnM_KpV79]ATI16458.1 hypothetical protein kpv79_05 [Klebsiella phage vB_KpnM_KpV79]